jgi:hypothetical protein
MFWSHLDLPQVPLPVYIPVVGNLENASAASCKPFNQSTELTPMMHFYIPSLGFEPLALQLSYTPSLILEFVLL